MDGATSATVRYAQVPRLKEMNVRPDVVTLTMGGNDLLQTFGSPAAAHAARRALWDNGHAALADLRTLVGSGAPILVGTIYDPSDGTGDAERLGIGSWPDAVAWIAQFNETLRALASEHGAFVADIHGRFLGHGLRAGQPAQADPRPADRNLWYCGVIEPNAWGAGAIRAVFWELLEQAGVLEP
jgi:lysophospholipase L1-like esterase